MPPGYRHLTVERKIRTARHVRIAVTPLMTWDMHRRAGLLVDADFHVATGGVAVLWISVDPVRIPAVVRVVEVVDLPTGRGFGDGREAPNSAAR